jgi:ubiquinone/menaquinone biosynthesis C-methylase UbiE
MSDLSDPTERFSSRAENYARYRPGYPQGVIETLRRECGLTAESVIADVGSGTGILTELFLKNSNRVFAVEPNEPMRRQAEKRLAGYPQFVSIPGQAEAITLPEQSVDFVTAGQSFHWFDATASRGEFERILRPNGIVALVWNYRLYDKDPLMEAYERVLADFGMGYHRVTHRSHRGDLDVFFRHEPEQRTFNHRRKLDFDGFWGGFLSASYAPQPGDTHFEPMRQALQQVFDQYQQAGEIEFVYDTHLYFGRLSA